MFWSYDHISFDSNNSSDNDNDLVFPYYFPMINMIVDGDTSTSRYYGGIDNIHTLYTSTLFCRWCAFNKDNNFFQTFDDDNLLIITQMSYNKVKNKLISR